MADFTFKHAVMTAGKSRELARIHYTFNQKGHLALVLSLQQIQERKASKLS